jgi:hypothetical protein
VYFWFLYCGNDDSGLSVFVVLMLNFEGVDEWEGLVSLVLALGTRVIERFLSAK